MLQTKNSDDLKPFLTDASNFPGGKAEGLFTPRTEEDIAAIVRRSYSQNTPLTFAGNGTGLTGARAPFGGWVLSSGFLKKVKNLKKYSVKGALITVEPGLTVEELGIHAAKNGLFYPPAPTSIYSFVGGNVSTNASGPQSFKYGPVRPFVERIRMVIGEGRIVDLSRGALKARDGKLEIPFTDGEKKGALMVPVPSYTFPAVKHAGGYFSGYSMDAVDLLIGSEGTLGVITELDIHLLPLPEQVFSFIIFFKRAEDSWNFSEEARRLSVYNRKSRNDTGFSARAIEYMDGASLELIRDKYPLIPPGSEAAVYLEQECQSETEQILLEQYYSLFEKYGAITDNEWFADDDQGHKRFAAMRHQVPLEIRDFLKRCGQSKIGTDFSVSFDDFFEYMSYQRRRTEELGLAQATFGHIGEAHVHLNIMPKTDEEFARGKKLYQELVDWVIQKGGSISAEHGIGKVKVPYFIQMMGEAAVREMARIKKVFDPKGLFGRGTLIPESYL